MSGESGRSCKQTYGQRLCPEPVIEKSFVENVTGFINEIVPQTYNNPSHYEGKEKITWVKFDHCDINDLSLFKDSIECNGNSPPLLLIIGYSNGVQAWVIPGNGEALEVFSWRQGPVRTLKILVSPTVSATSVDRFSLKRPILAICDAAGPCSPFHSVSFVSLKTGEQLRTIKFKSQVQEIYSNKSVVVVTFPERLAVFEATSFDDLFTISTCYRSPNLDLNPIALGEEWLAFADRRLFSIHQSCGGGTSLDGSQSYKSTVIYAAKSITKGLKELGESVASNLMGGQKGASNKATATSSFSSSTQTQTQGGPPSATPGVVSIVNVQGVTGTEVDLSAGFSSGLVAHFLAHNGTPIVALEFDPSGMLLATADKLGHNFHLFRIHPHPLSSSQAAVHHLYTLHRGDTTARVIDVSFSLDARWLAVSTHRGTTHVYAVTPYGGKVGVRTHKSVCVVNRLSRFQKSAGLDEVPISGRDSPVLSAATSASSPAMSKFASYEPSPNLAYPNPRYPPYPLPVVLRPLVQLRQPLLQNLMDTIVPGLSPSHSPPASKSSKVSGIDEVVKVASTFGAMRGWIAGSPTLHREMKRHRVDSLYVMAYHGSLIEYHLEPKALSNLPQEKVSENSPIELEVHATAQWSLGRESTSHELRPPLPSDSALLACDLRGIRGTSPPQPPPDNEGDPEEKWMAQVEIYTHAGPPRRLWMGPQFTFRSLSSSVGAPASAFSETTDEEVVTDPSLTFPHHHHRSSPVAMPTSRAPSSVPIHIEAFSLTGSQSPRLSDRCSVDSDYAGEGETSMSRLKNDLADAMMDTPMTATRGKRELGDDKVCESPIEGDQGFDFSDIMDISCDPPGLSSSVSGGGGGAPPDLPWQMQEENIQAVTAKLHQVAVTNQVVMSECVSPFWGCSRTPSLEECRAMTSSAEELASTLDQQQSSYKTSAFAWTPIDPPLQEAPTVSSGRREELDVRSGAWDSPLVDVGDKPKCLTALNEAPPLPPDIQPVPKPWSSIVEGSRQVVAKKVVKTQSSSDVELRAVAAAATAAPKSSTTSEDDLTSKDCSKKEKKRRRKKNRTADDEDQLLVEDFPPSSVPPSYPPPPLPDQFVVPAAAAILPVSSYSCSSPPHIDVEGDHFHPAQEFHDPLLGSVDYDYDDPPSEGGGVVEGVLLTTTDSPSGSADALSLLRSVHEGDDLARALEEASSDECASRPATTTSKVVVCAAAAAVVPREADERFPFRETSSDDDGEPVVAPSHSVRRRKNPLTTSAVAASSATALDEDEDATTTSGDDRRATSESDVTTSPNPRDSLAGCGKKKRKKKKK